MKIKITKKSHFHNWELYNPYWKANGMGNKYYVCLDCCKRTYKEDININTVNIDFYSFVNMGLKREVMEVNDNLIRSLYFRIMSPGDDSLHNKYHGELYAELYDMEYHE